MSNGSDRIVSIDLVDETTELTAELVTVGTVGPRFVTFTRPAHRIVRSDGTEFEEIPERPVAINVDRVVSVDRMRNGHARLKGAGGLNAEVVESFEQVLAVLNGESE